MRLRPGFWQGHSFRGPTVAWPALVDALKLELEPKTADYFATKVGCPVHVVKKGLSDLLVVGTVACNRYEGGRITWALRRRS